MKIKFEDAGYLEFQRSRKPHHVHVLVAARKAGSPLELLVNSAEVHVTQLLEAVKTVSGPLRLDQQGQQNEQDSTDSNSKDSEEESISNK